MRLSFAVHNDKADLIVSSVHADGCMPWLLLVDGLGTAAEFDTRAVGEKSIPIIPWF
jgi:hypothetical protein